MPLLLAQPTAPATSVAMTDFVRPMVNLAAIVGIFTVLRPHIDDNGIRGAIAWTTGPLAIEGIKIFAQRVRHVEVRS
jgi:hypothetical protein